MEQQVSAVAKSYYHQIRNIGHIRLYITENACKTPVCSFVTSWLDYGNALLYNVNSSVIARLQRVQNTAARMITRKKSLTRSYHLLCSCIGFPLNTDHLEPLISHSGILMTFYLSIILDLQNFFH